MTKQRERPKETDREKWLMYYVSEEKEPQRERFVWVRGPKVIEGRLLRVDRDSFE